MTPLEKARLFLATYPDPSPEVPADLKGAVRQILLSGERHSTKSLALRLGRPRDLELYAALAALLQERAIATDGASCEFYRRETMG